MTAAGNLVHIAFRAHHLLAEVRRAKAANPSQIPNRV
jgi:hypothetical protein